MVFFSAVREEGLLNLWKGLSPAVLRHMGTCYWYQVWIPYNRPMLYYKTFYLSC